MASPNCERRGVHTWKHPLADVTSFIIYVIVKTCHNFAADLYTFGTVCFGWVSAWVISVKIN